MAVSNWRKIDKMLRKVNLALAGLGAVLLLVINVVVIYDVVMRYGFNNATIWADDIARYLLIYVVFLGMSFTLQEGAHVSVDVFLELFNEETVWVLRLIGMILVAVFGFVFTWQTTAVTIDAFRSSWVSSSLLALPMKYIYPVGPISSLFFTLTAISLAARHVMERRLMVAAASQPVPEHVYGMDEASSVHPIDA